MPRFAPFPGLRYDPTRADLARVTAPPYDVIDAAERAALASIDPHNVVVIDLPVEQPDPYASAASTFASWRSGGVLVQDAPSYYGYRMTSIADGGEARHTTGVFGALELSAPGEGGILPHENTTPKAKTDRLDLTRATRANLSAVWGLSPAAGLTKLVEPRPDDHVVAWRDTDGVEHSTWLITDPARQAPISQAVASAAVVIADGHHRYEISLAYRNEVGAGADLDGAGSVLTYIVELAEAELTVLPIHRLIGGLPAGFDLLGALASHFDAAPAGDLEPSIVARLEQEGALCLVTAAGAWLLHPRPGAFAGVRDLDTSRLDAALDGALDGLPDHTLTYQHGVDQVTGRVASGEFQAGVLLRSCPVTKILEVAHGGERMPPKTTFFSPKPRTGVVFRALV